MESLKEYFKNDRFAAENGIEVVDIQPGFAIAEMKVEGRHFNCFGMVQGGALFTLAAMAFAGACNSAGELSLGMNMTISCIRPCFGGLLRAEATELARTKKTSTCSVRVVDESARLIALFQGTAFVKGDAFPPVV